MFRRIALALALIALACPPLARAQLPAPVLSTLAAGGIAQDAISVLVLRGDATVLSHLAERPMAPASTMKLVTTLVALDTLGPVFRGRTELRSAGDVVKGVLQGDLVLRGGADLDLSGAVLEHMLQTLRNQGIERIAGNLLLDRSLFTPSRLDLGAAPFDQSPEAYYNVIPDALLVNKNMLQIDMRSSGSTLKLVMQPPLDQVSIGADMNLIDADCTRSEDGWKLPQARQEKGGRIKVVLHGSFPKNCAREVRINVVERDDYVARLFRASWKKLGGSFGGDVIEGVAGLDARLLAEHASRALPELVRDINKLSDNALARTLFLSLGSLEADALLGSRPLAGTDMKTNMNTHMSTHMKADMSTDMSTQTQTTAARADLAVRAWMRRHAINDTGLVLENGSGLSRVERISALQMGALLQAGLRSDWAPEFLASLPIAALDGTMRKRLRGSPAAGNARIKTGALSNVVSIAGYVRDALGHQCVVVAMINSEQANDGKGRAVLDALLDWVARSGNAPGVAAPP